MRFKSVLATAVMLISLGGCSSQIGVESSESEFLTNDWEFADGIEFIYDQRTGVPTAPEVLDELNQQALATGSNVEWRSDAYGVVGELEDYVDDVFLSSSESGNRGCGLWVFGFGDWTKQAIDAGYFDWVEEQITWGAFSDDILGYVLIYSDEETECYAQAMNTVQGNYSNISKTDTGITLDDSIVIEYVDPLLDTVAIGNAGTAPVKFNDDLCLVTEKGSYVIGGYGRMVGVMNPQETIRFDLKGSMPEIDPDDGTPQSVAVGNCSTGEYRAIEPRN